MSEPGCLTSSDAHVIDDVTAGARAGSFDLADMQRYYGDAVADGLLLVDQAALLHHEFSPPSPAPQDALSYMPTSIDLDRYDAFVITFLS